MREKGRKKAGGGEEEGIPSREGAGGGWTGLWQGGRGEGVGDDTVRTLLTGGKQDRGIGDERGKGNCNGRGRGRVACGGGRGG